MLETVFILALNVGKMRQIVAKMTQLYIRCHYNVMSL